MLKYTKLLAAMALGVVAIHAQAVTQAQVTVSNLSFSLKDLTPNDGVAAALSFTGNSGSGGVEVGHAHQGAWHTSSHPWGTEHESSSGPRKVVQDYQVDAEASASLASASASVFQTAAGFERMVVSATVDAGNDSDAWAGYGRNFVLTPGTQVTFSMLVSGSFSGVGTTTALPGRFFGDHSSAFVTAVMHVYGVDLSSRLVITGQSNFAVVSDDFEETIAGQVLQLSLKNSSSSSKTYRLSFSATASVSELTAPIPEPSTYALMALGLLGVGAAVRRQRRG